MTKSEARDILFTLVYESEFSPEKNAPEIYDAAREGRGFENYRYIKKGLEYIVDNRTELEGMIASLSEGWKLDRIAPVTKAILLVALYDIKVKSLAPSIAINEAVVLAKKYDSDSAPAFINGILNSALADTFADVSDSDTESDNADTPAAADDE